MALATLFRQIRSRISLDESGMSLLSLVIVIMMFTAFTAITMLAMKPADNSRKVLVTNQKATIILKALKQYQYTNGDVSATALSQLVTTTGTACMLNETTSSPFYRRMQGWCGPYIDRDITATVGAQNDYQTDGWGTTFQFSGGILRSCGPDLTCGTIDDLTFTYTYP